MNKSKLFKMSYERRQGLVGYVFLIPWMIGTLIFFCYPFFHTVWMSFCDVSFDAGSIITHFKGIDAYTEVFLKQQFLQQASTHLGTTLLHTVCVLIISIFLAIILNQEFFGRSFWRVIFSLPIIVASGLVLSVFQKDLTFQASVTSESTNIFQNEALTEMLLSMGIGDKIIEVVVTAVSSVVDILWMSGVQILLFITGLQSISPSLYEVCDVEGATAWQRFWRVTFPLLTPYIFLNIIYSIIDISTQSTAEVMYTMRYYYNNTFYANASAAATGYFLMILVVLGVISLALSKRIVYIDK
ncbi:MAG: sugar ABC transporter permease [Clostridia bacterium]|nr:sugar ABC transporter permease [Clostridia bacterium]